MQKIAKNIKDQRQKHQMSQEDLAGKLYVTRQTISNYENGKSNPDIETLQQLANIFDTELDHLIYGEQKKRDVQKIKKTAIILGASLVLTAILTILDAQAVKEAQKTFSLLLFLEILRIIGYPVILVIIGASMTNLILMTTEIKSLKFLQKKAAHQIVLISWIGYLLVMLPYVIVRIVYSIDRYFWEMANPYGGTYTFSLGFGETLDRIHFSIFLTLSQFKIIYAVFIVIGIILMLTSTESGHSASINKRTA
ncbi:MAG: helix-turn-helix transcriptional regulator [Chitinivibrionales bacterium]|nr:helix-turn-helix transcriptional regulator [Chitinivibrionales bacterium]